jgi:hypothetical protein
MLKQLVDNGQEQTTAVTVAGTKEKNHGQSWSRRSFAPPKLCWLLFRCSAFAWFIIDTSAVCGQSPPERVTSMHAVCRAATV